MRFFRGNKYITLREWLAIAGNSLPAGLTSLVVTGPVSFSAADLFTARYGDRYISEAFDEDGGNLPNFAGRLTTEAARIYDVMAPKIEGVKKMLSDLYGDVTTDRLEYKRGPDGGTDFTGAFSDGGTLRTLTGQNAGNIDRIVRVEQDLVDLWDALMVRYEFLFFGARFGWGCDHGDD